MVNENTKGFKVLSGKVFLMVVFFCLMDKVNFLATTSQNGGFGW